MRVGEVQILVNGVAHDAVAGIVGLARQSVVMQLVQLLHHVARREIGFFVGYQVRTQQVIVHVGVVGRFAAEEFQHAGNPDYVGMGEESQNSLAELVVGIVLRKLESP